VPTTLDKDGRSRPPHLRSFRDGWRHLRFLLLFSPRWLFLYPGTVLLAVGLLVGAMLLPGPLRIGRVSFDVHTFLVAALCIIVGLQSISFAIIGRRFASRYGFIPRSGNYDRLLEAHRYCLAHLGRLGMGQSRLWTPQSQHHDAAGHFGHDVTGLRLPTDDEWVYVLDDQCPDRRGSSRHVDCAGSARLLTSG
jgi:hypothetical protein